MQWSLKLERRRRGEPSYHNFQTSHTTSHRINGEWRGGLGALEFLANSQGIPKPLIKRLPEWVLITAAKRGTGFAESCIIEKEYGLLGIISTSCDVYAFGIVMMETFMRKNPTDEMFVGEMNLRRWVKESLAVDLAEVADADLLKREDEHFVAKLKCVSSLMELAFACTEESPQGRTNMCDALVMLKKIKKKLLKEIKTRPRMRQQ
ncbi:LRR receptor-like serine/threonine-protein kinase [Tripterygium wilfordii]|uniref:LRR receptor-like serine/threonine-protein kinase n=1 Tax=Tripterygium wilfordii TaxID=458696 RepID=A0A7J7C8N1_TRIWF|nr:LRR receptor-like serine/threonine-protein kinase [Tripterygium wilfordii]